MPTKTKPKPKAKKDVTAAKVIKGSTALRALAVSRSPAIAFEELKIACESLGLNEGAVSVWIIKYAASTYERETGAIASQTRLIDFIRWWEEREKSS